MMATIVQFPLKNRSSEKNFSSSLSLTNAVPLNPREHTFSLFVSFFHAIKTNHLTFASQCISQLFGICRADALFCTLKYKEKLHANPNFFNNIIMLRDTVINNQANESLMLLGFCFGLQGLVAIQIYQKLRVSFVSF